jgi:hypothetical protein
MSVHLPVPVMVATYQTANANVEHLLQRALESQNSVTREIINQFMILSTQLYRVLNGGIEISYKNRLDKYVLNKYCKDIIGLIEDCNGRFEMYKKGVKRGDLVNASEELLEILYYSSNSALLKTKDLWIRAFPNTMSKKSFAIYC